MQIGIIGLGRMGANMAQRLLNGGHEVVAHNRSCGPVDEIVRKGAMGAYSLEELVQKLSKPRRIWLMVPSGEVTEKMVRDISLHLDEGDVVIDGGNSYFKDDVRRAKLLTEKKINFVDVGTSGGIWGAERGYCLMIGGDKKIVEALDPVFRTLAPGKGNIEQTPGWDKNKSTAEEGYIHCGPAGAGHFVKMVHNGIEYGLMQAYAEGFDILKNADSENLPEDMRFKLDLSNISEVWRRGSVISSWLLDLISMALLEDMDLKEYIGYVPDSGEGRWTIQTAVEQAVPADVLSAALYARFRSRQEHTFAEKILSAMRYKFGGHVEK